MAKHVDNSFIDDDNFPEYLWEIAGDGSHDVWVTPSHPEFLGRHSIEHVPYDVRVAVGAYGFMRYDFSWIIGK